MIDLTVRCASCDGYLARPSIHPAHCERCITYFKAAVYEYAKAYVEAVKA